MLRGLIIIAVIALGYTPAMGQKGACCLPNGVCIELTALECVQFGGDYQGTGTNCADVSCSADGACCMAGGACSIISLAECNSNGGDFQGEGTTCAGVTCPNCPGTEPCFVPHTSPGCNSSACCITVCEVDPFCCDSQWDGLCVNGALSLCGNCGEPEAGNCYTSNGTPGCENDECCAMVCAMDPFCCNTFWDSFCAEGATNLCNGCGDPDAGGCYVFNGTPACEDSACCESVCAFDSFCCDSFWDALCASEAAQICGDCGDPEAGSCFESNGSPGCDDLDCCAAVCAADSFCCDNNWDSICASAAVAMCANPCPWDCGDGNGIVGIVDLLALLGAYGGTGGPCDFQDDGAVDILDLLDLLGHWGACPN